uniref:NADH-ubiquinone oxidoreductase chain 4L n=3 Tax=Sepiella TaxID=153279 RepID=A0A0U2SK02_9MOLL|nr:NADH dehydrogenase subunit 4L [Sepiella japonica]YP_008757869.1 NADH dehydrogenase subunit 4L [Sepiella inermis]YP_009193050.1 NADH dehydrogenase subunit 4L [Sepiella maindroni]AGS18376.1 NADH dehydrogenase subunit 4L [Sepiella inermis]ALP86443.1 NADH dehydrogenase subunit 4L [Sepiella maindroni]BAM11171.1 NADH dehydrogenase subunit 4L [Sepiella japonica]
MAMNNELLLGVYIYLVGIMVLLLQWKHILNILLSFEILMLGVVFSFLLTWGLNGSEFNIMMIIIVFGVCEASLGLSMLVSLIRVHGNDYVNSLVMYKL